MVQPTSPTTKKAWTQTVELVCGNCIELETENRLLHNKLITVKEQLRLAISQGK